MNTEPKIDFDAVDDALASIQPLDPPLTFQGAAEACIKRLTATAGADCLAQVREAFGTDLLGYALHEFAESPTAQRLSSGEKVLLDVAMAFATQSREAAVADLFRVDKPTRQFVAGLLAEVGL